MSLNLKQELDELSQSKAHLISNQARAAKLAQEKPGDLLDDLVDDEDVLEELLKYSKSLLVLIRRAHLDELVLLLAQPQRLYISNFFLGLTRGLGFALGLVIIWLCYDYFIQ